MSTKQGYFLIADITGFTSFIAETELEHSRLIISEILNHLVKKFESHFSLVEIEGDAVFLYAPPEKFSRGEIILELVESAYYSFRDNKTSLRRLTLCNCKACGMTSDLDLKFVIHSGDFVLNEVAGKVKPMGTSVNIVHRLTKNKVSESTGWNAYVLFTTECLDNLQLKLSGIHSYTESYEHIGTVNTCSINLDEQYKKYIADRIEYISSEDADYFVEKNYSVVPSILWEWFNNPKKRSQWLVVTNWNPVERPFGRTGKGAVNHCTNSNFTENLLDYRPFDYYTSEINGKNLKFKLTGKFVPISEGTKLIWYIKLNSTLPKLIKKLYSWFILKQGLKIDMAFNKLDELLKNEINLDY